MILLWGVPGDAPLDAVRAALDGTGAGVRFFDQRGAAHMDCEVVVRRDGTLSVKVVDHAGEVDLATVGSAYVRPLETSKACGGEAIGRSMFEQALRVDASMVTWADLSHAAVVNPPTAMAANNSKPYQLMMIAQAGFHVPATLVTTDADAVLRFRERHGSLIYKSLSGVRSIVSRLSRQHLEELAEVSNCPTQFQEYIPGTDVRVHVAGESVIATEIMSTADDYRYASNRDSVMMRPLDIPSQISERCRTMVSGMGLLVAGIDFRRTPDGAWYCLEVNPSPGFTFFEAATGQRIGAAIANLLISLDRARPTCHSLAPDGHGSLTH